MAFVDGIRYTNQVNQANQTNQAALRGFAISGSSVPMNGTNLPASSRIRRHRIDARYMLTASVPAQLVGISSFSVLFRFAFAVMPVQGSRCL